MNLIIGGSSGLGKSIANYFAESGKTVVVSRRNIQTSKKNIISLEIDINSNNLDELYNKISENEISSVFFTAGLIDWENDNIFLNEDKFEKIFQTNFISIKKIIIELIKKKKLNSNCLICFCSSVTTILPRQRQISYCAAKSALNAFYKSLSTYLYVNGFNYRVANLFLGYMDTEMNKNIQTPFKKVNPDKIAKFIYRKKDKIQGVYYFPRYWLLIKIIVNLLPEKILNKINKILNF